jgi:hypothetical protein
MLNPVSIGTGPPLWRVTVIQRILSAQRRLSEIAGSLG